LKLVVPPVNVLAYASLPRWARRMYGTPAIGLTDAAVTLALRAAFESTTRIPPRLLMLAGASDARPYPPPPASPPLPRPSGAGGQRAAGRLATRRPRRRPVR